MQDIQIRKVKPTDNTHLARIIREVFEEHNAPKEGTVYSDPTTDNLYELFRKERSILWVATNGSDLSGCCGIYPTPGLEEDCAELVKFYLPAKARQKGIGKALMMQCFDSARAMGYKRLYLESLPHYARAVAMYERSGFRRLDAPMGSSGHTSCNIWMIKDLDSEA
jgi:putative acetyltransferase